MVLENFKQAEQELTKYIPAVRVMTGKDITLVRMQPLMKALGNPERRLKIIHIAGTSGKTSTAYYIAALLGAAGKNVGLTVSPHVSCINERLQVNLVPLSEKRFCTALGEFLELTKAVDPEPTYFELLIAFVYWYFAKIGVDYAVIETGLGGLHDATNIARQPDKVCVITDIGIDHTHVLGNTIKEIAAQKAGIMHSGNQTFAYHQSAEIDQVFSQYSAQQGATLNLLSVSQTEEKVSGQSQLPEFQKRNWLLAYNVLKYISKRDRLVSVSQAALLATSRQKVPGRMEVRKLGGQTIIFDGAHNEQKTEAFASSFQKLYPGKKAAVLLALKEGKEYQAVLPLLKPICASLIITSFAMSQDTFIRSIEPEILAGTARQLGFQEVVSIPNSTQAFKQLVASKEDMLVVIGSFYLLGSVMADMLTV